MQTRYMSLGLLLAVGLSGLWAGPQRDDSQRGQLPRNWPRGGPLRLESRTEAAKVPATEAEELARLSLQVDRDYPLRLTPAYFTDNDFPVLEPKDKPIWLVEARNYPLGSVSKKTEGSFRLPVLYLAIDAEKGRVIEAFTPPKNAWWEKMASGNGKEHTKYFQETGRVITWPDKRAPRISLKKALGWLSKDYPASQVIIRYATYSNQATVPKILRQDVWMIFSEGIECYPSVPFDPMAEGGGRRPIVIYGRSLVIMDAATGAVLGEEEYGDLAK